MNFLKRFFDRFRHNWKCKCMVCGVILKFKSKHLSEATNTIVDRGWKWSSLCRGPICSACAKLEW